MVQITRNCELFEKKNVFFNHFLQTVDAILEDVSEPEMIVYYQAIESRLPSFSVLKISPTRVTRLKIAPNMADPISIKNSRQ